MDPNANLREQEQLLAARHRPSGDLSQVPDARQAQADHARLWDLRQALYDWIRDGGFEPDWAACPRAAAYYGK